MAARAGVGRRQEPRQAEVAEPGESGMDLGTRSGGGEAGRNLGKGSARWERDVHQAAADRPTGGGTDVGTCEIARLPEELVSAALACTSPRDAYRAAAVSLALRVVADSDDVWAGFLPPDGFLPLADGEPPGPAPPSSKKERLPLGQISEGATAPRSPALYNRACVGLFPQRACRRRCEPPRATRGSSAATQCSSPRTLRRRRRGGERRVLEAHRGLRLRLLL
ncbi:hypothetical protein ZWY2020_032366 [Hordeum vulgare]|nr:hypothetical protein ZWY2020_032366 [Hordeum vulgare]